MVDDIDMLDAVRVLLALWSPRVDDVDRAGIAKDGDPRILNKAISISYLVVLSSRRSPKGSLLYYNPLPHRSNRNESLAGVTLRAETCVNMARLNYKRAVSDIRSCTEPRLTGDGVDLLLLGHLGRSLLPLLGHGLGRSGG